MTLEETKFLLLSIEALYPNCTFKDPQVTSKIWCNVLFDQNAEAIMGALTVYARSDNTGFAPSAGKLIEIANEAANPTLTTEEAVDLVRRAVGNSIYNSTEEFQKLPPSVQKAVISPHRLHTWAQTDIEEFETVCMSHFRKAYQIQVKRDQQLLASKDNTLLIGTTMRQLIEKRV